MHLSHPRVISTILVILLLGITGITVYSLSVQTHQALKGAVQDKLMGVAGAAASQIDGSGFSALRPGDEHSPGYIRIRDQLRAVKEGVPGIRYIYTLRRDGDTVAFVVDGDYGYETDTPPIGERYPQAEPELLAGFSGLSADNDFTTDQWGTVLSGFAPIRDRSGTVVGIVGVDMDSSVVNAELGDLNRFFSLVGIFAMILGVIGIIIVERRREAAERMIAESEKKYRLLFERAGDAIFLIGMQGSDSGIIISANDAAARMHGFGRGELEGRTLLSLLPPGSAGPTHDQELLVANGEWLSGEAIHAKKDGTLFTVEYSAGVLDLGTGKYLLLFNRDISERKKAENALHQATKKLTMLNAVTFSDIHNAVFTISGYLALARNERDSGKGNEALGKAEHSIRNISRYLTFAKSYQDLGARPPRWQNVQQVFAMGISHLDCASLERSVQLKNVEIYADPMLEQVFLSLADNVLAHATGATRITLRYEIHAPDMVLIFEDNGPGIPEAVKEKIFLRGFGSRRGMYLFLVREILSITGLTIRETGVYGTGARFEIHVPGGAWKFPAANGE